MKKFSLCTLQNSLAAMDLFAEPVPNFNIRGKTKVSSVLGSILSAILLLIVLFYGANKFTFLLERRNPTISSYAERGAVTKNDKINLRDENLRFAFGIEGFLDNELKADPRYVKWYVRAVNRLDGVES